MDEDIFTLITGRLSTGGAITSAGDVAKLIGAGVSAVIDLREEYNDAKLFADPPELVYMWQPMNDDGEPEPVLFWSTLMRMALPFLLLREGILHIHCDQGIHRGPSVAAVILMALGLTKDQALEIVMDARAEADPIYADNGAEAIVKLGYVKSTSAKDRQAPPLAPPRAHIARRWQM